MNEGPEEGDFWADLRHRLATDPEFREEYEAASKENTALDGIANATDA